MGVYYNMYRYNSDNSLQVELCHLPDSRAADGNRHLLQKGVHLLAER